MMDVTPPPAGSPVEILPGLKWLRMDLPFALDHINLWLIRDHACWTAIDSGINQESSRRQWDEIAAGHTLNRLICTHFHPDHMGLAGWMVDRFGIEFRATLGEWSFGRMLSLDTGEAYHELQQRHYAACGFDQNLLDDIRSRGNAYARQVWPLPTRLDALRDGETILLDDQPWRVIIGLGHAPQHACLFQPDRKILVAGDQVLGRISPVVGVWPQQPDENPLAAFLESLEKLRALPDDTVILPSHGVPFYGLHDRLDSLAAHHRTRLDRTRDAAQAGATVIQVARQLFRRPLEGSNLGFASGETLAHLNYLLERQEIRRRTDADGIWRYDAVHSPSGAQ